VRSAQRIAIILLATLLFAPLLAAHQQKESITRLLFNPRTGNIEVMHRFLLHDAEHAMRNLFGEAVNLLDSPADRDRFERYVHARFSMVDQHQVGITLTPVGNEIDQQFLWVYAECPIPEGLSRLTLTHNALRDLWPEQINVVNVERNKTVRSAVFREGIAEVSIDLSD